MCVLSRGESGGASLPLRWLTTSRLLFSSWSLLSIYAAFLGTWAWVAHGFSLESTGRPGADFAIFWAASHLSLQGSPLQVYDHRTFIAAQLALFGGFAESYALPWAYPPAFLLLLMPLSLLPFGVAYLLFAALGMYLFVTATLSVSRLEKSVGGFWRAVLPVAALPSAFIAVIVGQNSLLTAALAAFATRWVATNPARAGVCIGLLAVKPQMALVFPFVLVAARAWKTLVVAAATALAVTATGVLFCGFQAFDQFVLNANLLRSSLIDHGGQHFWAASPTTYAALRGAGIAMLPAYTLHAAVAVLSICAACAVWRSTDDTRLRAAILAVSALIVSPYVWHYELAWLGIALACIAAFGLNGKWLFGEQAVLALAWLLPLYEHFNRLAQLPQIGAIVLLLMVLILLRRARSAPGEYT
ncbi:hypothetical protein C9I57_14240 [Trinickia symbiotica]|uniref:DUF2029 domain-containing protein n=1 Tax=Trinickia symbiotica TaxID=863227 RepID=A0A2T3XUU6_9BURK|nr:glycosyltransferase family 87 protein [Trinickia symbiotica]PTB20232.1 hypothetical protein C9I57_14240 [Trinickia symbiotica]